MKHNKWFTKTWFADAGWSIFHRYYPSSKILLLTMVAFIFIGLPASAKCSVDQQTFWTKFRDIILAKKYDDLKSLTQLPIKYSNTAEDHEETFKSFDQLRKRLPKVLESDPGLSREPSTLSKYISETIRLPERSCQKGQISMGGLVFHLSDKAWRLVELSF